MNDLNEILWITQMRDENDVEIITLNAVSGTWERLHRIFPEHVRHAKDLKRGDVLITLKINDFDLADEDPLVISDHHGRWLLEDFFKLPKKIFERVKMA